MLLNTDMELLYDIDVHPVHGTTCEINNKMCHQKTCEGCDQCPKKLNGETKNENFKKLESVGFKVCQRCETNTNRPAGFKKCEELQSKSAELVKKYAQVST